jgi:acetyl-CoA synthetase
MSAEHGSGSIESVLHEDRVFEPPPDFAAKAHIKSLAEYDSLCKAAKDDPEGYWAGLAGELLSWQQPWSQVLKWAPPHAQWFVGGHINACENCVDRHADGPLGSKTALIWEGEPGETRTLTYAELKTEVEQFAAALTGLGVKPGDVVAIYMPLVPEAVVAMLACARIGAPHTVVFGGFSADALAGRIQDCKARVLITADGGYRRGKTLPLKGHADGAADLCPTIEHLIVLRRTGEAVPMQEGRDVWWHDLIASAQNTACPPVALDSEHPLFILYTSGSTGKPKGILHTTGGYLLGAAATTRWVFDLKPEDVYWCTADIGWVTGHTYVVYGPLALGATVLLYEGAPNWPDEGRFWKIIEDHKVSILYTAPTAIRAFMKWGDSFPKRHDLSSLRLLGSVGEPINPEAWMWYRDVIGGGRCPVVDTWWQTETGSILIAPLPGATPTKPGSATRPLPGIDAAIVDQEGRAVEAGKGGGYLVVRQPWPSMLRTLYNDDARYVQQYWSAVPGCYFTGDGARQDADGNFWILGRVDDVLNVAGHRLSTMEIESALVSHPSVAEAAVVGKPDDLKGQAIACFVTLESQVRPSPELEKQLREHVVHEIGALARPDVIRFAEALPKTRSGKIMRRLLRDIAAGKESSGDVSTLEDLNVLATLRGAEE